MRQVETIQQDTQLARCDYVEYPGEEDTDANSKDVQLHEATLRGPQERNKYGKSADVPIDCQSQ